jgi:predicted dehydrogenase
VYGLSAPHANPVIDRMKSPVDVALIGAGERGLHRYANYLEQNPDEGRIVAVADISEQKRSDAQNKYHIPREHVFSDWRELLRVPRLAEAVVVATPDQVHTEPAIEAMKAGYHVLLEKPMATNAADCRRIVDTAAQTGVILAVCHVLRYAPYYQKLKDLIDSGAIGTLQNIRHVEQIGFWHFAHSFVRGNWRNEETSSPVILAKSCHDMDILRFLIGKRCLELASFGSLSHFKLENAPEHSTERCISCPLADGTCAYSAKTYYLNELNAGNTKWPLNVITREYTREGVLDALTNGPYGRCVYRCDNNVLDHQVVNMRFEGDVTVDFTLTAFTDVNARRTDIYGSKGCISGDSESITVTDFTTRKKTEVYRYSASKEEAIGHLGGDAGIMRDFLKSVRSGSTAGILSGPEISLEAHLMAFAAERARIDRTVISL